MSEPNAPPIVVNAPPIVVNASPVAGQLTTALRDLLKVVGVSLAAKGLIDESWIEPAIGVVVVVGPVIWSQVSTYRRHVKLVTAAEAAPDSVARVKAA